MTKIYNSYTMLLQLTCCQCKVGQVHLAAKAPRGSGCIRSANAVARAANDARNGPPDPPGRRHWPPHSFGVEEFCGKQSHNVHCPLFGSRETSVFSETTISLRLKDPTLGFRFGANGFFETCLLASINGMHDEVPGTNAWVTASADKMCKVRVSVEAQNVKPCLTSFLEMLRNENGFSLKQMEEWPLVRRSKHNATRSTH